MKFEYEISSQKILFLDTRVYKEKDNLQTTLYRKSTDQQSFLHARWEHPSALENATETAPLWNKNFCKQNIMKTKKTKT